MEEQDKTQIDKTQIEVDKTQVDGQPKREEQQTTLKTFKGWKVIKELPAIGGEADAFLIEKAGITYFLKLYRKGINPKIEVLQKIKELSQKIPEHIVQVYAVGFDDQTGRYYEVMEYAKYGNLREAYEKYELKIEDVVKELAEAIHYLHEHNIIHRDIKPTNILVREVEPLDLILTDFGISSAVMEDVSKVLTTVKGTLQYSAPEALKEYFGKEIDWWSLGMIVYELLTGSNPFRGLSQEVIAYKLITEDVPIPKNLEERYQLLLKGLLTRDPKKRWKYEEIKRWLRGEKDIKVYYGEAVERKEHSEEEWQRHGFTPQGAKRWKETGLTPAEARAFRDAGFTPDEAKEWAQVGIRDAETAKGWRDTGIGPYEAYKLDSYGLGYSLVKQIFRQYSSATSVELIEILELFGDYESARSFIYRYFDSWKERGFTPEEAKEWINAGLSLSESIDWKKHGFTLEEAKAYKELGFDLEQAKEWKSLRGTPEEAKEWINAGLSPGESISWKKYGFNLEEAKALRGLGVNPYEESWKLIKTLKGHDNSVESVSFSPDGRLLASGSSDKTIRIWNAKSDFDYVKELKAKGMSIGRIAKWKRSGFSLEEIVNWEKYGFTPEEAKAYKELGFNLLQVIGWKLLKGTPEEAKEWISAGFSLSKSTSWKRHRFNLDEAKAYKELGFSPEQAKEWKSLKGTLEEAKEWIEAHRLDLIDAIRWRSFCVEKNLPPKVEYIKKWLSAGFSVDKAISELDFYAQHGAYIKPPNGLHPLHLLRFTSEQVY